MMRPHYLETTMYPNMTHRIILSFLLLLLAVATANINSNSKVYVRTAPSFPSTKNICHHRLSRPSSSKSVTNFDDAAVNNILSLRGGEDGDGNIQTITSLSQIQTILDNASSNNKQQLVVVDFTANNCAPCEMIKPIYHDLSQLDEFVDFDANNNKNNSNVIFCKVNVSDHPEVAEHYGVDGWPTFLLFKGGQVVDSVVGGQAAKVGLYGLVAKHSS